MRERAGARERAGERGERRGERSGEEGGADGLAGATHFWCIVLYFWNCWDFFLGVYRPWRLSHFFSREISVEYTQNHIWGPLGARVMSIFVKTCIFEKVKLGDNHGGEER